PAHVLSAVRRVDSERYARADRALFGAGAAFEIHGRVEFQLKAEALFDGPARFEDGVDRGAELFEQLLDEDHVPGLERVLVRDAVLVGLLETGLENLDDG